jgi:hypothetical protein
MPGRRPDGTRIFAPGRAHLSNDQEKRNGTMNGFLSRGVLTLAVAGGFVALGAGVAYADDTTDGSNGAGSGTQAVLGVTLPINLGGNGISILGDSSSSGGSATTGGSGGSAPSVSTGGVEGLLSGSQGAVDADVPITVGGNAISVLGDSSSEGSAFEGASGTGESGAADTSGKQGILGGSQVVGTVDTPVTVGGNAISVLGDSSTEGAAVSNGTSGASGSGSATTDGADSTVGGSQVDGDVAVPFTASGNAVSVIGDSSTSHARVASPATSGSTAGSTSGEDATLGGTQLITPVDAPVTLGGNAVSVVGDSTVGGGTGGGTDPGDPGDVGGQTTTPGAVPAAVGGVSVLAATGSSLPTPALAFAALLVAAGVTTTVRARTAGR